MPRTRSAVAALLVAGTAAASAQTPVYRASWGSVAAAVGAGALSLVPNALGIPQGPPPCAPCDPSSLPGIDRWVVDLHSRDAARGSDVVRLGVVAGAVIASVGGVPASQARGNASVVVNAVSWTALSTEWLKALVHRSRPELYTAAAPTAAGHRDSRLSFPSGHTSTAFAAATAYALIGHRQHLPHATRNGILLYAGAAGVGALRVAAGKHFVTDVAAGAALGAGVAWLVTRIHPTAP